MYELLFKIDKVSTMECKCVLMADFKINYPNMNEQFSEDTILTPFNLQPCTQSVPTLHKFTSSIDYMSTDDTANKHRTKHFKFF